MGVRYSKLGKLIGVKGVNKRLPSAPKGYVPICVGVNDDIKRFIVHRKALSDAEFLELLCKSAEEYDFCNQGVLRIPYEAKDFEDWLTRRATLKIIRAKPV